MSDLNEFAVQFADSLAKTAGYPTCITSRCCRRRFRHFKEGFYRNRITRQLEQAMEDRSTFIARDKKNDYFPILEGIGGDKIMSYVVTPIISVAIRSDLSLCFHLTTKTRWAIPKPS